MYTEVKERPLTEEEELYAAENSREIRDRTLYIGEVLFSAYEEENRFTPYDTRWLSPDFEGDLHAVRAKIESRLSDGGEELERLSRGEAVASVAEPRNSYGVRIDTGEYAFLFRFLPIYDEAVCYCYEAKWLDKHIAEARRGIRIIDSPGNEPLRLKDGDGIVEFDKRHPGPESYVCRYIDDTHFEMGERIYDIAQYAEYIERNGISVKRLARDNSDIALLDAVNGVYDTGDGKMIKTNIGNMPLVDYREWRAHQSGFDSYADMYRRGVRLGRGLDAASEDELYPEPGYPSRGGGEER